jgi:hypothetical protein
MKELKTVHEDLACDICGRTILKGERPETYLAPGGLRKLVCELCTVRAEHEGWIRETASADTPTATRRPEPRRSLIGRLRRRRDEEDELEPLEEEPPPFPDELPEDAQDARRAPARPAAEGTPRRRRKDARHVRAVPTNAEVKVERALELFNASEHPRKIAGIARSLGEPWITAVPASAAPSEVLIVVAWELSWYRFRVDLGDAEEPVVLLDQGLELAEIDAELREWNASADADGRLTVGVGSREP